MLPRARTAAAGALSADPVVPLLPRRRIVGLPLGTIRSVRRGGHFDPIGSRPYRPGDDPRRIDRHASARLSSASGEDVLIVREHLAEERIGVALAIDETPSMALHPPSLPWLHKPAAVAEVERIVSASAQRARSRLVRLPRLPAEGPLAALGTGSIVFLVSDFIDFPPDGVFDDACARDWDLVPVVLQDPIWERSFPDVSGVCLPLADTDGRLRTVYLSRREARVRRRENEERYATTIERLEGLGLEPIELGAADPDIVYEALLAWAEGRRSTFAWTA